MGVWIFIYGCFKQSNHTPPIALGDVVVPAGVDVDGTAVLCPTACDDAFVVTWLGGDEWTKVVWVSGVGDAIFVLTSPEDDIIFVDGRVVVEFVA